MPLQEEWFDAVQQAITKERELKEADEEKGLIKRLAAMRLTATEEEITRYDGTRAPCKHHSSLWMSGDAGWE